MELIQVLTFFCVCTMTCAQKPIQKAIDALDNKHRLQAQREVCAKIRQKQDVYTAYMVDIYSFGCLEAVKEQLIGEAKTQKMRDQINKAFSDGKGNGFESISNWCMSNALAWSGNTGVQEKIGVDLAMHFKCGEVWKRNEDEETE